jgi:hypothetical protein
LARTLGAILNARGRLLVDRDTIARTARGLVLNRLGSTAVGQVVQGLFAPAAEALGYRPLPPQAEPVVLNAKGASAAGKSTIRGALTGIVERLGYDWRDFAIISPDYWRKALIDYDGLGADFKYAAMMCGQELEVIDRKLDILMAVKGDAGTVPHMLIDRFRFDSFTGDRTRAEDSTLLTRFGARVFLFFLVTPPAATVERAWIRGEETGRYKAVDDLLFHNIEAYRGMPDLFFNWARRRGKWVSYEFLDNSVPRGSRPRSVAYGQNGWLVIRDLDKFCDIRRYQDIDVDATGPDGILPPTLEARERFALVRRALAELDEVKILAPGTERVFAQAQKGRLEIDPEALPDGIDPTLLGRHQVASLGVLGDAGADYVIGAV